MDEILKAIEERDCKKVSKLLYYKVDELSDEELKEILERAEKLALECKDPELYKLIVYYFHALLDVDKISEFEKLAEEMDTFEAKFNLADLYYLIGELEKSLELYRALLEEETARGRKENVAKVYYNMALIHEEIQEYEKALELLEKAEEVYRELEDEGELLHIAVYKAYVTFEAGEPYRAKAMLAGLLPKVMGNSRLMSEIHLSFEEIFEEDENYDAALQECLYALMSARGMEYWDIAFDALIDVIWQLMLEDDFETVYLNMDMFASAMPELADFFEAIKAVALYKDGKIDAEEASRAVEKVKDRRLIDLLEFLGEAEF
ncbi:tetratricopeptide repeat protein [Thermococcus sp. M36]|uniref:tetratricopeptide repeat protein n=1 Tax=Thermococcus sp. M36 TaxID=1638261 RepID=UPI00143A7114|nr:tetratricopeptide repeat protein [Thermococcus sp. M36]NJE06287.1 tetratricopeptide repeat protein [Thermococcus sp. M36]